MKIGHIIVPAGDIDRQLEFYDTLGLRLRFRDNDRYAALTDGNVTLGLAAEHEQPVPGQVSVSIVVEDLDATIAQLAAAGITASEPVRGEHERRCLVTDPAGTPIIVYETLT